MHTKRFLQFTVPIEYPSSRLLGSKFQRLGLEMSLQQDGDWTVFVDPVVASLDPIVRPLIKQATVLEVV